MRRPHPALVVLVVFAAAGAALLIFGRSRPDPAPPPPPKKIAKLDTPQPQVPDSKADPVEDAVLGIESMLSELSVQIRHHAIAGATSWFSGRAMLFGGLEDFLGSLRAVTYCVFRVRTATGTSTRVEGILEAELEGRNDENAIVYRKEQYDAVFASTGEGWRISELRWREGRGHLGRDAFVAVPIVPSISARKDTLASVEPYSYFGPLACGDYDNDGDLDLYSASLRRNWLLRNDAGTFAEASKEAGVYYDGIATGAVFADVDDDGDLDLITTWYAPSQRFGLNGPMQGEGGPAILLFRNRNGRFSREEFATKGPAMSVCAADVDGDGDIDFHVAMGREWNSEETTLFLPLPGAGVENQLWINDGQGRFLNEAKERGLADPALTISAAFGDWDGDGDPDLAVANESRPVKIYRNDGGKFALVAEPAQTSCGGGLTWLDWDGDGALDLYVAGRDTVRIPIGKPGAVLKSGTWETLWTDRSGWAWCGRDIDVDGDGPREFYVGTGFIDGMSELDLGPTLARLRDDRRAFGETAARIQSHAARHPLVTNQIRALESLGEDPRLWPLFSLSGQDRNALYRNGEEIAAKLGLGRSEPARAIVVADLDRDGDEDLVVRNFGRGRVVLALRNDHATRKGLTIRLRAIGTRVTVEGRMREFSSETPELYFPTGGLVKVRWPSGRTEEFPNVPGGMIATISKGKIELADYAPLELKGKPEAPAPRRVREGDKLPMEARNGVFFLFSTACDSCAREVQVAGPLEEAARKKGMALLWMCVDPDAMEREQELRAKHVVPVRPETAEHLLGAGHVLPVILITDAEGRVQAKFCGFGSVDAAVRHLVSSRPR